MKKTCFLPKKMRPEFKKIWGIPFFNGKKETVEKFRQFIKKKSFKKIITVGDYCSLILSSDIKIFDGKIKRKKTATPSNWKKNSFSAKNPAGMIKKEVWPVIKKAIENKKNVFIEGEEDLLVLPCVLLSKKNTAVIYGFPDKGFCLIEVSPEIKKAFREILKKFETK